MEKSKSKYKKKKATTYSADIEVLFLHHPRNRNHPVRLRILESLEVIKIK